MIDRELAGKKAKEEAERADMKQHADKLILALGRCFHRPTEIATYLVFIFAKHNLSIDLKYGQWDRKDSWGKLRSSAKILTLI